MNQSKRAREGRPTRRWVEDETGAGMVEYALLLLLIAIALVGAAGLLGESLQASFNDAAAQF